MVCRKLWAYLFLIRSRGAFEFEVKLKLRRVKHMSCGAVGTKAKLDEFLTADELLAMLATELNPWRSMELTQLLLKIWDRNAKPNVL